jgi:flagellar motor switch protein FliM
MMLDSGEPLLTAEETDALLRATRASSGSAPPVTGADLASPERPLRQALERADVCGRELARNFRPFLLRTIGTAGEAKEMPPDIVPYAIFCSSIPTGSAICTLRVEAGAFAAMVLGPQLVAFLLERRLGASMPEAMEGSAPAAASLRTRLSALDRRVLLPFAQELVRHFGRYWCEDHRTFAVDRITSETIDLPELLRSAPLLRITLQAEPIGSRNDEITFVLAPETVAATLSLDKAKRSQPLRATQNDRRRMLARVETAQVEVVAVLGQANSSVREVLALEVGDVIRLESVPGQPAELRIEGCGVLRGNPVVHHGNLAIEVQRVG